MTMHESGWADAGSDDEPGSHTTLRPIYTDEAADYMHRMFSRIADSQQSAFLPEEAAPAPETAEPTSLLDDLKDMGWLDS